LSKFVLKSGPEDTSIVDMFVFEDDGGVEPEVQITSGLGVFILPFLNCLFIQHVSRSIIFVDNDVLPFLVLFSNLDGRILQLGSPFE